MTHFQQLYDREYLGSWDLPEGRDAALTIEHVKGGELTAIGGKKSKKPIISFVGKEKKFICNKTNAKAIAGMYGNHVEKWAGKRIALYVSTTRDPSTGGDIPCIRVRPQAPQAIKEDEIPVVGNAAPQASPPPSPSMPAEAAFISEEQMVELDRMFAECDEKAKATFLKIARYDSIEKLPATDFAEVTAWIGRRKTARATKGA